MYRVVISKNDKPKKKDKKVAYLYVARKKMVLLFVYIT